MASIHEYTTKKHCTLYRVQYVDQYGVASQKRGFRTKALAREFVADVESEVNKGTFIKPVLGETTVGELGEVWLATRTHMKISTRNLMTITYHTHIEDTWSHLGIGRIRHSQVQQWVASLDDQMSASSVRRCHSVLAQILEIGVKDRLIPSNPARGVRLPKRKKSDQVFLTLEQVATLAGAAKYPEIIWVLATTGLRWGELCVLRPRDIDLKRRRIKVLRAMIRDDSKRIYGEPKTHEKRTVAVPTFVCNILADLIADIDPDVLIWPGRNGGPMVSPATRLGLPRPSKSAWRTETSRRASPRMGCGMWRRGFWCRLARM